MAISLPTNIIIISIIFSLVAIAAVALRFHSRRIKRASLGIDDYLIIPALAFAVALGIVNIISAVSGNLGGHVALGPNGPVFGPWLPIFLKCEWACQLLSVGTLAFTKISILLFYKRIFRGPLFEVLASILGLIVAIWGISFFFATLFECFPISQVWTTLYGEPRKCYKYLPMFYATAVSNMIIDFLIIAMPWPMIWRLQMPTRQKFAVGGVFTLGALVCGISIARLVFFIDAGKPYANSYDITYNIAPTLYWTQLEGALAVVSACLPTMRPLFHGFSPESILGSFRTRVFRHRRLDESSNTSRLHSYPRESQSSFEALTKPNHASSVGTYIESRGMDDLKAGNQHGNVGIRVHRDISSHSEAL